MLYEVEGVSLPPPSMAAPSQIAVRARFGGGVCVGVCVVVGLVNTHNTRIVNTHLFALEDVSDVTEVSLQVTKQQQQQ